MVNMGLTGSPACVKYLLFVFNLIFLITGIIILSIGSVIQATNYEYEPFLDSKFFSAPAFLIAIGSIVLIISFFGCCGAVKENRCMIITFSLLLVVIFIFELAAGIAGYVLKDEVYDLIVDKMNSTMTNFTNNVEIRNIWNSMQTDFACCGTLNYTDWSHVFNNNSLPISCCKLNLSGLDFANCSLNNTYSQGCLHALGEKITDNVLQIGGAGVGVAFIQILGIILACCLASAIKQSYETV